MSDSVRVAIAGSGNVASHLALAIVRLQQYELAVIASRNLYHATALAERAGCPAGTYADIRNYNPDIVIISVADNAVADVVAQIGRIDNAVVALTSGTIEKELAEPITPNTGVLYPLQSFTSGVDVRLSEVPFFIEGSNAMTLAVLEQLAKCLSGQVYHADGSKRQILHIAGVLTNNFVNILLEQTEKLLLKEGYPLATVAPLARMTVEKAFAIGPHKAQTGPAKRNDMEVITRQESLLPPELLPAYKELTRLILESHK